MSNTKGSFRGPYKRQAPRRYTTEACTCTVQRATVGNDHAKSCLLYRQRGDDYERLPPFSRPIYGETWWNG